MTLEEALNNTFVCTNLPGGHALVPFTTCIARQEKQSIGRPGGAAGYYRFLQCLDCDQGKKIKIRYEKNGGAMGAIGTCHCCGRSEKSLPQKAYDDAGTGHEVCGFCIRWIKDASLFGWSYDRAKPYIASEAIGKTRGGHQRIDWPWQHKNDDLSRPSDSPVVQGEYLPATTKEGEGQPSMTAESNPEPQVKNEREKAADDLKAGLSMLYGKTSDLDDKRYIVIDLDQEQDIAAWLHETSRAHRRGLKQQVLWILDNQIAADRELGRYA